MARPTTPSDGFATSFGARWTRLDFSARPRIPGEHCPLIGWWAIAPGLALIAAGFVIQFGTYSRWPISVRTLLFGVRIRFIGIGVLFLGIGADFVVSSLFGGLQVGMLVVGLVMIGFGCLWFYAASDRIFRQPPNP